MTTLSAMLNTGVSALRTFQTSLQVTSHNISNTNTEGYSRQRALLTTMFPFNIRPGQIGMGVTVEEVKRMRLATFDATVRVQQNQLGRWEQLNNTAQALERMFGDATYGTIGKALDDFWNGWHDLTTGPEEMPVRQAVLDRGVSLADSIHDVYEQLTRLAEGTDLSLRQDVSEANTYIKEIADLNDEIKRGEMGGNNANDLRDKRDLALEKLSRIVDIEIEEPTSFDENLVVTIGGDTVVDGQDFELLAAADDGDGHQTVEFESGGLVDFETGRFQGYRDSYARIDETTAALNDLAEVLITEVNDVHGDGFDLDGLGGDDFFSGSDASDIAVNEDLLDDPRLIAASASDAPGNGDNALALAQLSGALISPSDDQNMTVGDFFSNLMVNLGSQADLTKQRTEDYTQSLEFVRNQRRAISGVNMDEEVANMLSFQHAYNAAARVITTVDEMMDRVINHTGRVGL